MSRSLDGVLIKRPHQKLFYSEHELIEIVKCADPDNGPFHFLKNYFNIQHPVKGKLLFEPFDYQLRLVDSYHNYRYSISLLPRQSGKTTAAAGYLLWYAMFRPDSTILIAAHKYAGAQEIMQKIRYAYELCPDFLRAGAVSYNKGSIEFDNGSRIVSQATTENTGRGMAITLLYCDEFAFVRPTIATEFWTSISPTLSTGGKAIITSTPNSDEDQFALIWKEASKTIDEWGNTNTTGLGVNGFKAFRAHWNEHPDRDEEWAKSEEAKIGTERFRREFGCEFIIYDETLISPIKLVDLVGIEPIETHGAVRWYKKPNPSSTYVISLDPSLGTGGDYAAIEVIDATNMEQVGEWQHNKTPVQGQIRVLVGMCRYLQESGVNANSIYYSLENNTIGEAGIVAINEFGEENIPGSFLKEGAARGRVRRFRSGFTTTNSSKLSACVKLKQLIENGRLKIYSKNLISELKTFVALGNSYEAKLGETDDLVMSMILATRMMQQIQSFDSKISQIWVEKEAEEFVAPMPFSILIT